MFLACLGVALLPPGPVTAGQTQAPPTPASAQRVRVRAGQETSPIDIGLIPGKVGALTGTALSSLGVPLAGECLNLMVEIRGENFMMSMGQSTRVSPYGTFAFRDTRTRHRGEHGDLQRR